MTTSILADKNKRCALVSFISLFIDLIAFSIIFPLFPAMLKYYFHDSASQGLWIQNLLNSLVDFAQSSQGNFPTTVLFGGLLAALYSFLQFIFAPLWGSLSDRIGRKHTLLFILCGTSFSYLIWFLSGSFSLLVLSRFVAGAMSGNITIITATIADITDPKKRTRGMALIGMAFGFGFLVGPAFGGMLSKINLLETYPHLEKYGINPFSIPAIAACIITLLNILFVSTKFEETLTSDNRKKSESLNPLKKILKSFAVKKKEQKITNLINLLMITSFGGVEFSVTFLASERFGYTSSQNSLIFIYCGIIMILGHALIRRCSHLRPVKSFIYYGLISACVGFIILAQSYNLLLFYIGLTFMGIATSIANPSLITASSSFANENEQGQSLGSFRSAGSLARVTGPLLGGIMFFCFGIEIAYTTLAFMLIAPMALTYTLPPIHQLK